MRPRTHPSDEPLILHGLADAFGLESLLPFQEDQISQLMMRATMYRYRHCLYFQAHIDKSVVQKINSLMKKDKYDDALKLVKERAQVLYVPEEFLDSWDLIPDRRLDPWRNYAVR